MESSNFSLVVQLVMYEIILRRKTDYWSVTVYETAESCLDKKECIFCLAVGSNTHLTIMSLLHVLPQVLMWSSNHSSSTVHVRAPTDIER